MNGEQTGTVTHIGEEQSFGASNFRKRPIVIEYAGGKDGQYPTLLCADMTQDRCAKLDEVNVGDVVTLKCDVKSREYNGRYYHDVICWHLTVDQVAAGIEAGSAAGDPYPDAPVDPESGLPF